ncbi:trypsin 5G1-like [Choristoneura fumiferana]|uniref:trypsin 5G1-like n=1 Tax=Choristoneura fumiferana TaxID=7141 RepID=UPI003D15BB72
MLSTTFFKLLIIFCDYTSGYKSKKEPYYDLSDHTIVTSSNVFPYVAAILEKSTYLCAGALIAESWVLTSADSLFLLRDSMRFLHVRLGSINNKRGGTILPIKFFEIHPFFDDTKPEYDIALVQLPQKVRLTPSLNPIRLQKTMHQLITTHFIVTAWPSPELDSEESQRLNSMESIKRRRMLSVSHLHPMDPANCSEQLEDVVGTNVNLMCLEQAVGSDPCARDAGAPVVLNGILWGIISSWKPGDCDLEAGPSFVNLVSSPNISTWIHATVHGKSWNKHRSWLEMLDYDDDYPEE